MFFMHAFSQDGSPDVYNDALASSPELADRCAMPAHLHTSIMFDRPHIRVTLQLLSAGYCGAWTRPSNRLVMPPNGKQ